jgi:hypothetical protein
MLAACPCTGGINSQLKSYFTVKNQKPLSWILKKTMIKILTMFIIMVLEFIARVIIHGKKKLYI